MDDGSCTYAYIDKEEQKTDKHHMLKRTVKKIRVIGKKEELF